MPATSRSAVALRATRVALLLSSLLAAGQPSCIVADDESSPEDDAWAEFRRYLKPRQKCVADEDCVVVDVECPLGCAYGVNAKYATEVRREAVDMAEGFDCPSCTHIDAAGCHLVCSEGKCLGPYESGCGRASPDAGP